MVDQNAKGNRKTVCVIYYRAVFSGLGVAVTKRGGLGVSPISSVCERAR